MTPELSSGPHARTPEQIDAIDAAVAKVIEVVRLQLEEHGVNLSAETIARAAIDYYLWELR